MGTTYNVKHDLYDRSLNKGIDSLLIGINNSVSTYIPESLISVINNGIDGTDSSILVNGKLESYLKYEFETDTHFLDNFQKSFDIFKTTDGYFDPTIMSLVNYWGFGYAPKKAVTDVDSAKVSALKQNMGLEKWTVNIDRERFRIIKPLNAELDFSGIAKGYAVDKIAELLSDNGAQNFMVEIGGEVYTKGVNEKGKAWTVGLNTPKEDAKINEFVTFISVNNKGLASSGNYRNFYIVDGKKYGHEINPKTGYPEINVLKGVSVVANTCMEADAYATAFMVMGLEKSKVKIKELEDIEACFFYFDEEGKIAQDFSIGFNAYVQ